MVVDNLNQIYTNRETTPFEPSTSSSCKLSISRMWRRNGEEKQEDEKKNPSDMLLKGEHVWLGRQAQIAEAFFAWFCTQFLLVLNSFCFGENLALQSHAGYWGCHLAIGFFCVLRSSCVLQSTRGGWRNAPTSQKQLWELKTKEQEKRRFLALWFSLKSSFEHPLLLVWTRHPYAKSSFPHFVVTQTKHSL